MSDNTSNNQRLAKNTFVLYIRMIFVLLVNLYLSRVILDTLGVKDYGIYNVVGGFVTMFSLLSSSLSNAISRFITVEIGRGDLERQRNVFSASITVMMFIAGVIFLLLETVGLWFLNNKMQIPADRMYAANWVLQCSIATFVINIISIPYNGTIIGHERMSAYAFFGILEVILKLVSTLFLYIAFADRLITYAFLIALSALFIRFLYGFYCSRNFNECHYNLSFDKTVIKDMLSMASWNFLGSGGAILNNQGVNVLINLFFGVTLNAARGIATQVNTALQSFAGSFITALNPQITKSYVKGDIKTMRALLYRGIKFSYFLIFIGALPIFIEAPFILKLWLKVVPEYTIPFIRLTILSLLTMAPGNLLYTVAMANGRIKNYQLVVGSLSLSIFCITYIAFKLGANATAAYLINFVIDVVILIARVIIVNRLVNIDIRNLIKEVFLPIVLASFIAATIPVLLYFVLDSTTLNSLLIISISVITTICSVWFVGINNQERLFISNLIKSKIRR